MEVPSNCSTAATCYMCVLVAQLHTSSLGVGPVSYKRCLCVYFWLDVARLTSHHGPAYESPLHTYTRNA